MAILKRAFFAVAAFATLASATTSPTAAFAQSYYDEQIPVYNYVYYNDPDKTDYAGTSYGRCVQSGSHIYVTYTYSVNTPYYDEEFQYMCTRGGPYLPPGDPVY